MRAKGIITVASEKASKLMKAGKLKETQLDDDTLYHLVSVDVYSTFTFDGEEFIINISSVYPECYLCTHKNTGLMINRKGEQFPQCGSPKEAEKQGKIILQNHLKDLRIRFNQYAKLKERVAEKYKSIKTVTTMNRTYLQLYKMGLV